MQWERHTAWRKSDSIYKTSKPFASIFNKDDFVKDSSRRKMSNMKKVMGNYCSGEKTNDLVQSADRPSVREARSFTVALKSFWNICIKEREGNNLQ